MPFLTQELSPFSSNSLTFIYKSVKRMAKRWQKYCIIMVKLKFVQSSISLQASTKSSSASYL